jgi:hypothetical protein
MIKTTTPKKSFSKKIKATQLPLEPKFSTIEMLLNYSKSLINLDIKKSEKLNESLFAEKRFCI